MLESFLLLIHPVISQIFSLRRCFSVENFVFLGRIPWIWHHIYFMKHTQMLKRFCSTYSYSSSPRYPVQISILHAQVIQDGLKSREKQSYESQLQFSTGRAPGFQFFSEWVCEWNISAHCYYCITVLSFFQRLSGPGPESAKCGCSLDRISYLWKLLQPSHPDRLLCGLTTGYPFSIDQGWRIGLGPEFAVFCKFYSLLISTNSCLEAGNYKIVKGPRSGTT